MDVAHSVETERKFDVARPELSPPLQNLRGVGSVDEPVEHLLEAQYFDSSDLVLARHRITLRRRSGGEDDGWHLKLPLDDADSRRELQEPLGAGDTPPEALVRRIRVHLRGRKLVPVVRLSTRRVVHRLRGADDTVLAEIADDHVHAEPLLPGRAGHDWREWEVELVSGGPDLLDAVQDKFAAAGVHRAGHASKLARALGSLNPESATPPDRTDAGTGGRMLMAYVNGQVQALQEQDPQVRDHVPDAVHQMRVATRRLRSALATQRRLLEPEPAAALRAELRWFAGVLGEVRDTEVMQERLLELLATEPQELVMGPVAHRINEELSTAYSDHYRTLLETMDQERYFRLLDSLDQFRKDPPMTAKADKKPKSAATAIGKDGKRLRKAVKDARSNRGTPHGDESLHEARKAAKRLRYAAEAAAAVDAKQAGRLEQAAHSIQKILGRHQDSVVARDVLRRLAEEAFSQGENAFSYGRLHALEQNLAVETETDFYDSWKTFPAKLLK